MRIFFVWWLLAASSAQAALIDNGTFTTDDISSLDWLDLNVTSNTSVTDALSQNSGWRLPTNAEVEGLFASAFPEYMSTHGDGFSHSGDLSISDAAAQLDRILEWHSLLGTSGIDGSDRYSYGLYQDENSRWRMIGSRYDTNHPANLVFGPEFQNDYWRDYSSQATDGHEAFGVLLTRTSVVPIPAAAWLFGSALLGLGFLRRCIHAP